MGLLEKDGVIQGIKADVYHRIKTFFGNEVRMKKYSSEEYRKSNGDSGEFYNIQGLVFTKKEENQIKAIYYAAIKRKEEHSHIEKIPEKKDAKGKVITKAGQKDVYVKPYEAFEDVL